MTLKTCKCKQVITTKNSINLSRIDLGIFLTCPNCKTTGIFRDKNYKRATVQLVDCLDFSYLSNPNSGLLNDVLKKGFVNGK